MLLTEVSGGDESGISKGLLFDSDAILSGILIEEGDRGLGGRDRRERGGFPPQEGSEFVGFDYEVSIQCQELMDGWFASKSEGLGHFYR